MKKHYKISKISSKNLKINRFGMRNISRKVSNSGKSYRNAKMWIVHSKVLKTQTNFRYKTFIN
jgi:hypothetical protein